MILDAESQTLRLAASRGVPEGALPETEVKMGDGVVGRVAQTGEPVQVDDVESDARFAGASCYGNGSYICMPIRAGDRIIGVINMAKRREAVDASAPSFSAIDLQFLNALMTYIGYAVDNARLLEEAQESARRLQTVVDDLSTTQEQLVRGETLRAMGQLASGMAHHLNNLFAVVLGRTELLLGSAEGASARRSLEIIHRAAEDGADVTRQVQRFSRLHPLSTPVAVDLNRLAVDALEQTRSRWQDETDPSGPRFGVKIEPGPIPLVVGEVAPVREALVNVVVNALDAMPEGGSARLRTWVDGERVRCAISDTGVGMSEEVRRRALQPFFTTKGPKSTGLGLSVAYGALQRYGGSLEIASESGRGTTITISLPVAAAPEAADGPIDHLAAPVLGEP
jgi:signal transduction histidine kinase